MRELVRSAGEARVVIRLAGGLPREQRTQMGRSSWRGQELGGARVRSVQHPDVASGPGLPGRPFDRVVAIQSEISLRPIYDGMPTYLESLRTYEDAGFSVTGLYLVTRDFRSRVIEYDVVMIRN